MEIATALASIVLRVDAFDEPNVTEAKRATQEAWSAITPTVASPIRPRWPTATGSASRRRIRWWRGCVRP